MSKAENMAAVIPPIVGVLMVTKLKTSTSFYPLSK